ncbi:hypothetical protein COOONC_01457 [Cooperia oncophora]
MLTRKNSSGRAGVTSFPGRESIAAISDMLTTQQKKVVKPGYISSERLESALKIACIISLITVCLHTPKTFERLWPLTYIVLCLDLVSVLILTLEVMLRIHHEGLSLQRNIDPPESCTPPKLIPIQLNGKALNARF